MNPPEMNVQQMLWKPALIKLTQAPYPDVDGNEPTACYVDPSAIVAVSRLMMKPKGHDGTDGEPRCVTFVNICHGHYYVTETPEQVAMARDRALGHESKPRAVE